MDAFTFFFALIMTSQSFVNGYGCYVIRCISTTNT